MEIVGILYGSAVVHSSPDQGSHIMFLGICQGVYDSMMHSSPGGRCSLSVKPYPKIRRLLRGNGMCLGIHTCIPKPYKIVGYDLLIIGYNPQNGRSSDPQVIPFGQTLNLPTEGCCIDVAAMPRLKHFRALPRVSIVVPFLVNQNLYSRILTITLVNQKRNYNGDSR